MAAAKMHADERDVDAPLARRLLIAQFPQWADLPLVRVASDGTDNAIYRLGDDMAMRMPRYPSAAAQATKESHWLPRLAPHLPLDVPLPLGLGEPDDVYPWPWSVVRWLPGEPASLVEVDALDAALRLARFVGAVQAVDAAGGPEPGEHNFGRGAGLATRDGWVRDALAQLDGMIDVAAARDAWEQALAAPAWERPPVWLHGDLHDGNMLAASGRLTAVIDFGCLGVGDPACDVMPAWTFLPADARPAFRAELGVDEATWERGRGWALSVGLIALPYYRDTNPPLAESARRWIDEVLADRDR